VWLSSGSNPKHDRLSAHNFLGPEPVKWMSKTCECLSPSRQLSPYYCNDACSLRIANRRHTIVHSCGVTLVVPQRRATLLDAMPRSLLHLAARYLINNYHRDAGHGGATEITLTRTQSDHQEQLMPSYTTYSRVVYLTPLAKLSVEAAHKYTPYL
jgi:hypothetical protein